MTLHGLRNREFVDTMYNVLQCTWKIQDAKISKNSPFGHHCMTLYGLCYREFVNTMYNILVQQFRDGKLRLSEALAEFTVSSYSSLKFFFVADRKAKNSADLPSLIVR